MLAASARGWEFSVPRSGVIEWQNLVPQLDEFALPLLRDPKTFVTPKGC